MRDQEDPQAPTTPLLETFDVSDTNLIIRSSDLVDFRVHKSVLAMASPFFKDLLSLPQPSDSEMADGLPVVRLPETSELLTSLISFLYPVPSVIPNSYEKVLYRICLRLVRGIIDLVLQGVISSCGVSEIRDGFSTVVYPC